MDKKSKMQAEKVIVAGRYFFAPEFLQDPSSELRHLLLARAKPNRTQNPLP